MKPGESLVVIILLIASIKKFMSKIIVLIISMENISVVLTERLKLISETKEKYRISKWSYYKYIMCCY